MNTRSRTLLVIALVVLAGCTAPSATPTAPQSGDATQSPPAESITGDVYEVTITEVVDGDTVHVRYANGSTDTVRLLGVDTPEVHTETRPGEFEGIPVSEAGREWLRDWGHKASEFARIEIAGERVHVVVDDQADRRGSYGRLLAYVYHGEGEMLNRQLLQQGYARMYDSSFSKRAEFRELESRAQADGVGLWGYGGPTTTPRATTTRTKTTSTSSSRTPASGRWRCRAGPSATRADTPTAFRTGSRSRRASG